MLLHYLIVSIVSSGKEHKAVSSPSTVSLVQLSALCLLFFGLWFWANFIYRLKLFIRFRKCLPIILKMIFSLQLHLSSGTTIYIHM